MYNSWVEISKSAIVYNLKQYQRLVGKNIQVMPVVKSNAYGHGMVDVAKIVSPYVKWIGVVSLGEAIELRRQGIKKKIFVLTYAQSRYLAKGIKEDISLPVYDLDYAKLISSLAKKNKKIAKVHIKIDTGATRVGVLLPDALQFVKAINQLPNLKIEGIYSHFAASEENESYTTKQLNIFKKVLADLKKENIEIPVIHFGCSAASLVKEDARFDMIRLGVSLYGLWPSEKAKKIVQSKHKWFNLKPALTWKTKIAQVKEVPKGTKVGYGCTYTAKKKMKIAVMTVGYWEGYDRHLSNSGEVIVKDKRCKIVGRVCMNITMIDVTNVKNVKAGDEVVLLGKKNTADEMAEKIGTINYEVVTRINPVLQRRYLK